MEKHIAVINGVTYNLPPFNAGQMRKQVDPVTRQAADMLSLLGKAREEDRALTPEETRILTLNQREISIKHAELLLAALQNQYPKVTLDDVETLTPTKISHLYNEIYSLTVAGDNEPGEALPSKAKKK